MPVCITQRLEDSSFEDPRSVVKNPRHDATVTNLEVALSTEAYFWVRFSFSEPTNTSDIR